MNNPGVFKKFYPGGKKKRMKKSFAKNAVLKCCPSIRIITPE
jgi:hypothetical protein